MNRASEPAAQPASGKATCLARSVVDALSKEPSLEAITINRTEQKISVATLGKTDEPRINDAVAGHIQKVYEKGATEHCKLLEGAGSKLIEMVDE